jgi:glycosyltransferase involved in cell wall biosynthesis
MLTIKKLKKQEEILASWKGKIEKPLVSICCITYNHGLYIEKSLEGFLIQETDFPFEILIHDDASTDSTANIIREYEVAYPKIIKPIYQSQNQFSQFKHINSTFNFPRAKGQYIALCEGDDYWTDKKKLQTSIEFLRRNKDYIACCHDVKVIDQNNFIQKSTPYGHYKGDLLSLEDQIKYNNIPTLSLVFKNIWGTKFSKTIKQITRGSLFIGDYPLKCLLLTKGKIKYFKQKMGVYRFVVAGSQSFSSQPYFLRIKDNFAFFYNLMDYFQGKNAILMKSCLAYTWARLLISCLKNKEYKKLNYYFIQGLQKQLLFIALRELVIKIPLFLVKLKLRRNY